MKCLMMTMAAAALALAAVAQEPAGGGKARSPRPAMMMPGEPVLRAACNPKMAEKLGLTEEQSAKIKALADDKSAMKALHEKVRKGMERQTELLKAEKIDEAAVMAALDEVFEARKEIAKCQTKRIIAVKSILTPEQIGKASDMLASEKARRREKSRKGKKPSADAQE